MKNKIKKFLFLLDFPCQICYIDNRGARKAARREGIMKTLTKVEITIARPNGDIETKDISTQPGMRKITQQIFDKIKTATKIAGRGDVLGVKKEFFESNMSSLIAAYNRGNNEGGEGYIPSEDYFRNLPEYSAKITYEIIK